MKAPGPIPPAVLAALVAVRRRRRLLAIAEGVAWATASPTLALTTALILGSRIPSGALRTPATALLIAFALLPFLLVVVPVWRRTRSLMTLARAVDERVPETGQTLGVAVDLSIASENGRFAEGPERLLVGRALSDASFRAGAVDAATLLPWSAVPLRAWAAPALLLAAALIVLILPSRSRPGLATLFGPTLLTETSGDATANMVLRNLRLTLTPPPWSTAEVIVLDGTSGDFEALPGTVVRFEADGPEGDPVELLWEEDPPLPGTRAGAHLQVEWTVVGAGSYRVRIGRSLGRDPFLSRAFRVQAIADVAPRLEVTAPAGFDPLAVSGPVPVEVRTSDDHALGTLRGTVTLNGVELSSTPIAEVRGLPSWTGAATIVVPAEAQERGGRLELQVISCDARQPPQCTTATVAKARVATDRDRRNASLAAKEALLARALSLLDGILVSDSESVEPILRSKVLAQHEGHQRLASALLEAARTVQLQIAQDRGERQDQWLGLGQIVENLARRWQGLDDHVQRRLRDGRVEAMGPAQIADLRGVRALMIDELERAVIDLAAFISRQNEESTLAEVNDGENALAKLMDAARKASQGQPVSEEIARALDELRAQLSELAASMAKNREAGLDSHSNQVPSELGEDVLKRVEELLAQGKTEEAMKLLSDAQRALQELREQMEKEDAEHAGSQELTEIQKQMKETLDETKKMEAAQEALRKDTQALGQRSSGTSETERTALAKEAQAIREGIARLHEGTRDELLRGTALRHGGRLIPGADAVRSFIEGSDFESAAMLARELAEGTADLSAEARTTGLDSEGRQRVSQGAAALSQRSRALARKLDDAGRRAQKGEDQAAKEGQPLSDRQGKLAEGMEALRRKVQQIGGGAFNPAAGRDQLGQAQRSMEDAEGRLQGGRPGNATSAQEEALRQLRQFREGMEGAQGSMGQRGRLSQGLGTGPPGSQPGGTQSGPSGGWERFGEWDLDGSRGTDEVVMPRPEDFVSPEAYRALVQEGASQEGPGKYRPLNNAYFEELLK